jgi:hypothetical protein
MKKQISVAALVMGIGGVVAFLFSFFDFIGAGSVGYNGWSNNFLIFPVYTMPAILGLATAVVIVLELLGTSLPGNILTFNWNQIKVTWGVTSSAIMLGFVIADKGSGDTKVGAWFVLLGSLAMAVGSIMAILGKGNEMVNIPDVGGSPKGSTPPPPPPPPASA